LPTPPVNVGFRSTPNYDTLAAAAIRQLPNGIQVFAGQRDDPFFVDLNVFDLLAVPPADTNNSDSLAGFNVHSIAIQVPKRELTRDSRFDTVGALSGRPKPDGPPPIVGGEVRAVRREDEAIRGDQRTGHALDQSSVVHAPVFSTNRGVEREPDRRQS
jgi:hypothetical protein